VLYETVNSVLVDIPFESSPGNGSERGGESRVELRPRARRFCSSTDYARSYTDDLTPVLSKFVRAGVFDLGVQMPATEGFLLVEVVG